MYNRAKSGLCVYLREWSIINKRVLGLHDEVVGDEQLRANARGSGEEADLGQGARAFRKEDDTI